MASWTRLGTGSRAAAEAAEATEATEARVPHPMQTISATVGVSMRVRSQCVGCSTYLLLAHYMYTSTTHTHAKKHSSMPDETTGPSHSSRGRSSRPIQHGWRHTSPDLQESKPQTKNSQPDASATTRSRKASPQAQNFKKGEQAMRRALTACDLSIPHTCTCTCTCTKNVTASLCIHKVRIPYKLRLHYVYTVYLDYTYYIIILKDAYGC